MKIFPKVSIVSDCEIVKDWPHFPPLTAFYQLSDFDLFVIGDYLANEANNSYRIDFSTAGTSRKYVCIVFKFLKHVLCFRRALD